MSPGPIFIILTLPTSLLLTSSAVDLALVSCVPCLPLPAFLDLEPHVSNSRASAPLVPVSLQPASLLPDRLVYTIQDSRVGPATRQLPDFPPRKLLPVSLYSLRYNRTRDYLYPIYPPPRPYLYSQAFLGIDLCSVFAADISHQELRRAANHL